MDEHLEVMRARGLEGEARMKLVLRCGAYVGEVIRRHSPTGATWHWQYLENGAEDSVRVFARAILARAREDAQRQGRPAAGRRASHAATPAPPSSSGRPSQTR